LFEDYRYLDGDWLALVQACCSKNLSLSMVWERYVTDKSFPPFPWHQDEERRFNWLGEASDGAFRKVKIDLVYYTKRGNGVEGMTELAERCVSRLLGANTAVVRLIWSDELVENDSFNSSPSLRKHLVAEKKN
jgi:hypothetical protein